MLRIRRAHHTAPAGLLLAILAAGCQGGERSAAAEVSATDVRQIPEERKLRAPDIMMQAADRGRVLGVDSAPVKILVISDFQCDSCRIWFENTLPIIRAEYVETGRARLTWVHYPLREHPNAVRAASAALCAGAQGKFWEASARLFAAQRVWAGAPTADAIIDSLAAVPDLESYKLLNCTASGRMLRQIRGDIDWSDTAKAGTPPLVLIGSRRLRSGTPINVLRAVLDSAISGK